MVGNPFDYNYVWVPNVSSTLNATGLAAGTYEITVSHKDDASCNIVMTGVVGNIDAPSATATATAANCDLNNGTATLLPANLNYSWYDGSTASTRNDLAAGTYGVTVYDTDANCFNVVDVTIDDNNPLVAEPVLIVQPSCGDSNGSVTIDVTGGSGSYTYSWGAGPTRDQLTAGSYNITVTDTQNGCQDEVHFVLVDNVAGANVIANDVSAVSYTHLTLPTTPYV